MKAPKIGTAYADPNLNTLSKDYQVSRTVYYILEHNDEIISVGELNRSAKNLLENNFNNVSVI